MNGNGKLTNNKTSEASLKDGNELKQVLKIAGFSQREIAEHIGFSSSYVSNVVCGSTPLTLRFIEGVRRCLGDTLFSLAIQRARQLDMEKQEQLRERRERREAQEAQQLLEEEQRLEQRRTSAIAAIQADQLKASHGNGLNNEDN